MFLKYIIFTVAGMHDMNILTISLLLCAPYCSICRAIPWLRLLVASL